LENKARVTAGKKKKKKGEQLWETTGNGQNAGCKKMGFALTRI